MSVKCGTTTQGNTTQQQKETTDPWYNMHEPQNSMLGERRHMQETVYMYLMPRGGKSMETKIRFMVA